MIASAPISTAECTFCISTSRSLQSLDTPRLTLILVFNIEPIPFGTIPLWFLLHGMITFPSATNVHSLSIS